MFTGLTNTKCCIETADFACDSDWGSDPVNIIGRKGDVIKTLGSDPFTGNVIFMDKGVRPHDASPNIEKYFNLEIYNKGQEDERLFAWRERTDVIDRERLKKVKKPILRNLIF